MKFSDISKRMEETSSIHGVAKWTAEEVEKIIQDLGGDPNFVGQQIKVIHGAPVETCLMYVITLMLAKKEKE